MMRPVRVNVSVCANVIVSASAGLMACLLQAQAQAQPGAVDFTNLAFDNGVFSFQIAAPTGGIWTLQTAPDATGPWTTIPGATSPYSTSAAGKPVTLFRLAVEGGYGPSVIGFLSVTLPPGFSIIGNPLENPESSVSTLFAGLPLTPSTPANWANGICRPDRGRARAVS